MATLRIGAVGDLHYGRESRDVLKQVFQAVDRERPDVMLLLGDLTDYGTVEEAQGLTRELRTNLGVPTLVVLGNHDFEGGAADAIRATLREGGITVLDGDSCEVKGVGFAGVKGFCGGFGRGALGPWGEDVVKGFVNEAVQEALKLESALARLRTPTRIVLLHYAPIVDDGRRRAAGDLSLDGKQSPGRAARPARRDRDLPRPRAQGTGGRSDGVRDAGLQRLAAAHGAADAGVSDSDPRGGRGRAVRSKRQVSGQVKSAFALRAGATAFACRWIAGLPSRSSPEGERSWCGREDSNLHPVARTSS